MQAFDRKFIENNALIERYLDGKLPPKGARDLEDWCRAHPEHLAGLGLAERARLSLKLLEASGSPQDLRDPPPPWWKANSFIAAAAIVTLASLLGFWVLFGKYALLHGELEDARAQVRQGSLAPPGAQTALRIAPDRAAAVGLARVPVNHAVAQMLELRIDMSYSKVQQFRVTIDKKDQGRVLVIDNLLRDSNGDLKVSVNTSAMTPGRYDARIEALPLFGTPNAEGWLMLDVR